MWSWLNRQVRRIRKDQSGNVIIYLTVAIIPIMASVAVAVDFGQYLVVKRSLANAIDAAALAVGTKSGLITVDQDGNPVPAQQAAANSFARSYIYANYPRAKTLEDAGNLSFSVEATNEDVTINATATIDTVFLSVLQLLGAAAEDVETLDVILSTMAARGQINLEVVMALDNTGSMGSSGDNKCSSPPCTKLDNLKFAANTLLNEFFGPDDTSDAFKIGLVPFSGAVNIGTDKIGSGWLDETRLSAIHDENLNWADSGLNIFDLYNQITNASWAGCVRARTENFDVSDDPPDASNPDTLWTPYFAPDEPDDPGLPGGNGQALTNNYLGDGGIVSSMQDAQSDINKYSGASASGDGPNYNCVPQAIQPLTNVRSTISTAIAGMAAEGFTVIPQGLAWAWRVISPGIPFIEGVPYDDPQTKKAIILLTDGANSVNAGSNNFNEGDHTAYGYPGQAGGHLGAGNGSEAVDILNAKVSTLCSNIKNAGIILYTITFQVSSGSAIESIFQACASDQSDPIKCPTSKCAFASGENLSDVFREIALSLKKLRLAE